MLKWFGASKSSFLLTNNLRSKKAKNEEIHKLKESSCLPTENLRSENEKDEEIHKVKEILKATKRNYKRQMEMYKSYRLKKLLLLYKIVYMRWTWSGLTRFGQGKYVMSHEVWLISLNVTVVKGVLFTKYWVILILDTMVVLKGI